MVTLLKLKNYLQTNGPSSLLKIAKDFTEDPKQIMCVAEHYIVKGKIFCEQQTSQCGTCHGCFAGHLVKLSWVNEN